MVLNRIAGAGRNGEACGWPKGTAGLALNQTGAGQSGAAGAASPVRPTALPVEVRAGPLQP
jgi:hypothetical protein